MKKAEYLAAAGGSAAFLTAGGSAAFLTALRAGLGFGVSPCI